MPSETLGAESWRSVYWIRAVVLAFLVMGYLNWLDGNWSRICEDYQYGTLSSRPWRWRMDETVECGLWSCAGLLVITQECYRRSPLRRSRLVAAAAMMLLGLASIVEMKTRASWWPWWLLVWNHVCGIAILMAANAELCRRRLQPA